MTNASLYFTIVWILVLSSFLTGFAVGWVITD